MIKTKTVKLNCCKIYTKNETARLSQAYALFVDNARCTNEMPDRKGNRATTAINKRHMPQCKILLQGAQRKHCLQQKHLSYELSVGKSRGAE